MAMFTGLFLVTLVSLSCAQPIYSLPDHSCVCDVSPVVHCNSDSALRAELDLLKDVVVRKALPAETGETAETGCPAGTELRGFPEKLDRQVLLGLQEHGARDVTGYGNDGVTFNTSVAEGPGGETGGAMYFHGTSGSRVEFPNNGALHMTSYITLQAWIYPEGTGLGPIFQYQREGSTDEGVHFWIYPSGNDLYIFFKSGQALSRPVITRNEWQFVTATYHRTTGVQKLYRNAIEIGSDDLGDVSLFMNTRYPLATGARPPPYAGGDRYAYKGRIAHMQVYNIALTQAQIQEAMDRTRNGYR
ncbi:uncharacterized protein LOC118407149 [Branchiostoma floridae]|uniref:Uncharacterized protein LOC118407149 n=1 Tax=Branchiostoma floridae TaxID=7739 RepID=A0A9J7HPJ1_BRAFL|nr:uncharacterized protein LOC118407149 [Branchiostoma floridae]